MVSESDIGLPARMLAPKGVDCESPTLVREENVVTNGIRVRHRTTSEDAGPKRGGL